MFLLRKVQHFNFLVNISVNISIFRESKCQHFNFLVNKSVNTSIFND